MLKSKENFKVSVIMNQNISLSIIKNMMNLHDDLIVIFQGSKLILANNSFLNFFQLTSVDDFNDSYEDFADCFVSHPFYFNKTKIVAGKSWIESILELDEDDKIVSMITPSFEPYAFLVRIDENFEEYIIVRFTNITQMLIKKIMIDNAKIPLLSNLKFSHITDIVKLLQIKVFQKDEIIIHEGSEGDAMYFIIEGSVLVYNKNVHVQLKEGDFFGEIALLKNVPRTATVKATNTCKTLELTTHDFQTFVKTEPELLKEIEKVADSRQ